MVLATELIIAAPGVRMSILAMGFTHETVYVDAD